VLSFGSGGHGLAIKDTPNHPPEPAMRLITSAPLLLAALATSGYAQQPLTVFGIDWESPSNGLADSFFGNPLTEGDLLLAPTFVPSLGPLGAPGIVESAGVFIPFGLNLAQHAISVGHPGGVPGGIEVDAISHGLDRRLDNNPTGAVSASRRFAFSVDYWSRGIVGTPAAPAVWTEATCQDQAADVMVDIGLPPLPIMPGSFVGGNNGWQDGNGLASCIGSTYPGNGLIENPPGTVPGDNLDALDGDVPDMWLPATSTTYFSLDASFVNPITGVPLSGSALLAGYVGGDVLRVSPTGATGIYAPAAALGLDMFGADTDDLDALAIAENGIAGFQPSLLPFDWMSGSTDMLLFSVRRGSAVVGLPDSIFGMPIEPSDILVPPTVPGGLPGILVPGEALGLMTTRSFPGFVPGDELDALDTLHDMPAGTSFCSPTTATPCPCGNNGSPGRGCGNSVNALGALLWGNGLPSISNDSLLLSGSGMPNTATTVLLQGTAAIPPVPFGDGLRCVGGTQRRVYIRNALLGNIQYGFNVPGQLPISIQGAIGAPGTYHYQIIYRNTAAFCTAATTNTTNGLSVTWIP
jgi:hypothetical protein